MGTKGVINCVYKKSFIARVTDAYHDARFLCEQYYLAAPALNLEVINRVDSPSMSSSSAGEKQKINVVYIPSHLHHMLFELFKVRVRVIKMR